MTETISQQSKDCSPSCDECKPQEQQQQEALMKQTPLPELIRTATTNSNLPDSTQDILAASTTSTSTSTSTSTIINTTNKTANEQNRLISTLQHEKEHLQNQCSAFETAGIQACIHNTNMKNLIHTLQSTIQSLNDKNDYLVYHLQGVSSRMGQVMQEYTWHVQRFKVLKRNHCHLLQCYADLQRFCKWLSQGNGGAISGSSCGSGSGRSSTVSGESTPQNPTSSSKQPQDEPSLEKNCDTSESKSHYSSKHNVKPASSTKPTTTTVEIRKHRPFLQPKRVSFADKHDDTLLSSSNQPASVINITQDLLLEESGGKKTITTTTDEKEIDSLRRGNEQEYPVQSLLPTSSSPFPSTKPLLPLPKKNKTTHHDLTGPVSSPKCTFTQNQVIGDGGFQPAPTSFSTTTTTPILQHSTKNGVFTQANTGIMKLTDHRQITPSPPIRTQAGQHVHPQNQENGTQMMQTTHDSKNHPYLTMCNTSTDDRRSPYNHDVRKNQIQYMQWMMKNNNNHNQHGGYNCQNGCVIPMMTMIPPPPPPGFIINHCFTSPKRNQQQTSNFGALPRSANGRRNNRKSTNKRNASATSSRGGSRCAAITTRKKRKVTKST